MGIFASENFFTLHAVWMYPAGIPTSSNTGISYHNIPHFTIKKDFELIQLFALKLHSFHKVMSPPVKIGLPKNTCAYIIRCRITRKSSRTEDYIKYVSVSAFKYHTTVFQKSISNFSIRWARQHRWWIWQAWSHGLSCGTRRHMLLKQWTRIRSICAICLARFYTDWWTRHQDRRWQLDLLI